MIDILANWIVAFGVAAVVVISAYAVTEDVVASAILSGSLALSTVIIAVGNDIVAAIKEK